MGESSPCSRFAKYLVAGDALGTIFKSRRLELLIDTEATVTWNRLVSFSCRVGWSSPASCETGQMTNIHLDWSFKKRPPESSIRLPTLPILMMKVTGK